MLITETSHNTVVSGLSETLALSTAKRREVEQDLMLAREARSIVCKENTTQREQIAVLQFQLEAQKQLNQEQGLAMADLFKKCDEQEGCLRLLKAIIKNPDKRAKKKGKK